MAASERNRRDDAMWLEHNQNHISRKKVRRRREGGGGEKRGTDQEREKENDSCFLEQ